PVGSVSGHPSRDGIRARAIPSLNTAINVVNMVCCAVSPSRTVGVVPDGRRGPDRHSARVVVGSRSHAPPRPAAENACVRLANLMSSGLRIALALLVVCASACSAAKSLPSSSTGPPPSRHVLSNGVRVVIQEDRAGEVVALQLWVKVGSRDELADELGLAHYLEHMLFKGTVTQPAGFIDRDVEGVGGRMNAGTSLDYTYYHMLLPATRALSGIETLADISVNATLEDQALQSEKRVVLEEMRFGEDNPSRFLVRQLYVATFRDHPYGRPVIGRPDVIRALTREQLFAFYRRYYVPQAFTLVVVRAVRRDQVVPRAHRAFARLPGVASPRLPVPTRAAGRDARVDLTRPVSHAYLAMGWIGPRIDHADMPALDLLVSVLGQTRGSRLTQALRERLGVVNSI